jgi:hypothetical protein
MQFKRTGIPARPASSRPFMIRFKGFEKRYQTDTDADGQHQIIEMQ